MKFAVVFVCFFFCISLRNVESKPILDEIIGGIVDDLDNVVDQVGCIVQGLDDLVNERPSEGCSQNNDGSNSNNTNNDNEASATSSNDGGGK
ncbi:hypothetical protein MTP99_012332 [Tenebrio molitor]|jgi:hypothetical protein|nr:hypothetical protein MTP99_012332 [Tenebrio molitor]CAH1370816.1 unnamed protein product [Tenebrio molitor]